MKKIKIIDITEQAFSQEDAEKVNEVLYTFIDKENCIEIDFKGILTFTTSFFNHSFAKYFMKLGQIQYVEKFKITNLEDAGNVAYNLSIDNAKNILNTL